MRCAAQRLPNPVGDVRSESMLSKKGLRDGLKSEELREEFHSTVNEIQNGGDEEAE
jgi:hypothetical protein